MTAWIFFQWHFIPISILKVFERTKPFVWFKECLEIFSESKQHIFPSLEPSWDHVNARSARVCPSLAGGSPRTLPRATGGSPASALARPCTLLYAVWFGETTPVMGGGRAVAIFSSNRQKESWGNSKLCSLFPAALCDQDLVTILNMLSREDHSRRLLSKSQPWLGRWRPTGVRWAFMMRTDRRHQQGWDPAGAEKPRRELEL